MLVVLETDGSAQPNLPYKDVARQLLAPKRRILEHVTHYHLIKYQRHGKYQAAYQQIFFYFVIYVADFSIYGLQVAAMPPRYINMEGEA